MSSQTIAPNLFLANNVLGVANNNSQYNVDQVCDQRLRYIRHAHSPSGTAIPLKPIQLAALDANMVLEKTSTQLGRFGMLIRLFFSSCRDEQILTSNTRTLFTRVLAEDSG